MPPRSSTAAIAVPVAAPTINLVRLMPLLVGRNGRGVRPGAPPLFFARSRRPLVALMRGCDVGEGAHVRRVVAVHAIAELVVRRLVREPERTIQERSITLRDSPQLDVDDVVAEPAAVRPAAEVGIEHRQAIGGSSGCGATGARSVDARLDRR